MRTHLKKDKIQEALELLNSAAQEKRDEIYEILGDKYEHLKEVVGTTMQNGHEIVGHAKKKVTKGLHAEERKLRQTAASLDKKIHKDPWMFLGGVALGSLAMGLFLGHKK